MTFEHFMDTYSKMLVRAIIVHLGYVTVCLIIGTIIALFLAIVLSRTKYASKILLPVLSVVQTIPGIVFIGILFIYIGITPLTIIISLSIYSIFPILKNSFTGISNVDKTLIEAGKGCGMNKIQILFWIEIPMALPSIFTGIKVTSVYLVSWTVLAAMIGLGGLGEFIYRGVSTNNSQLILIGALPAAVIAVSFSRLIYLLQKKLLPKGLLNYIEKEE